MPTTQDLINAYHAATGTSGPTPYDNYTGPVTDQDLVNIANHFTPESEAPSTTTAPTAPTEQVTDAEVRALFEEAGIDPGLHSDNTPVDPDIRIASIVDQINSGTRTLETVKADIQRYYFGEGSTFTGATPQVEALPKGARLIKVGDSYRVIWDLGAGLGVAWYSINSENLTRLYGDDWNSGVAETFSNASSFSARYGDFYWGNIAEVSRKATDPWQDLKGRLFESFGYLGGIDTPEIKRLILQSYFEEWDDNEFLAGYRNTEYFATKSDAQRSWATLSDAEKQAKISEKTYELMDLYSKEFGYDPPGGPTDPSIVAAATEIASGLATPDEFAYTWRIQAEGIEGSPAWREVIGEGQARGEAEVTRENLAETIRQQWRAWVGPSEMPSGFAENWAQRLFMNEASDADLEQKLKSISMGYWNNKPEDLQWNEWAAPFKGDIERTLELGTLDDNDPLLRNILSGGLTGQEANLAIRSDNRFKNTNQLYQELSSSVGTLGRTFGFIR